MLGESTLGVIFTDGDPVSNVDNSLVGVDFQYLNTRLPGDRTLEAEAWYQETDTPGCEDDDYCVRRSASACRTPKAGAAACR